MPPHQKGYKPKKKRFSKAKQRGKYKPKTEKKAENEESLPKEQDQNDDTDNASTSTQPNDTNTSAGIVASDQLSPCPTLHQESENYLPMDTDVERDCTPAKLSEECQANPIMESLVWEVEDCYPETLPEDCHQMNVSSPMKDDENKFSEEGRTLDESPHPILKSSTSEETSHRSFLQEESLPQQKYPLVVHCSEKHPASVVPPTVKADLSAAAIPKMHDQEKREGISANTLGVHDKEWEPARVNPGDSLDCSSNSEHESANSSTDNEAESISNESSNSDRPQEAVDNRLLEDDVNVDQACVTDEGVDGSVSEAPDSPMVPVLTGETLQFLERVKTHLLMFLPISKFQNWNPVVNFDHGILVGLVAPSSTYVVQRSIRVTSDGKVTIAVHGKHLSRNHRLWTEIQDCVPLEENTVEQFSENILKIVASVRLYEICCGVDSFKNYWKHGHGEIDNNRYREMRYKETFRPDSCLMLVKNLRVKRCEQCIKVHNAFSKRQQAKAKMGEGTPKTPKSTKPRSSMSSGERKKRMDRDRKEKRNLKRKNKRLQEKVKRLMKTEGELLDQSMSDDLLSVLKTANLDNMNDLQKIFLTEQIKAASRKDPRGNTWHPAVIRIALAIRMASAAAYEQLKGVLTLPSEQTLFNYSHVIRPSEGVHNEIVSDLAESLYASSPKPHQLYHVLSFDAMKIKKNLVYSKRTGEMIGFVHLNEVEKEIAELDKLVNAMAGRPKAPQPCDNKPPVADSVLCYMVNGLCNDKRAVVASYGATSLNTNIVHSKTWEVVGALELAGLKVIVMCGDGAAENHGFFESHPPWPGTEGGGVVYATANLYDPTRPIFMVNDPPHLLKTARNNLYYSGKRSKRRGGLLRNLIKNGQSMRWDTIIKIYEMTKGDTLRALFKLNQDDIYLNSYSIMRVIHAAHVLSKSVANFIRGQKWQDCEELANFCELMNEFFDIVNGSHPYEATRKRNDNLRSFENSDDPRLGRLLEIWQYFEEWKTEVNSTNLSNSAKAKRILSKQTLNGLERGIKGFIGTVKFVLEVAEQHGDKAFINGDDISQDDLEHAFGKHRSRLGGNRHPDLHQVLQNTVNFYVQSRLAFFGRKKGNPLQRKRLSAEALSKPLPKARKSLEYL